MIRYRKLILLTKRLPIPQCTLPPMTFNQFKQNDENVETSSTVNENSIADITVSGDGSWQKRGF